MRIFLKKTKINKSNELKITGSKSETNRVLLLQAIYSGIKIKNLSNSEDSKLMRRALLSESSTIDIHHAGTAMRFLTAYFSIKKGQKTLLSGSKRMHERPIKILVDALKSLGANIKYTNIKGYPPLQIEGMDFNKNKVSLKANISSQYISALLLIAPTLKDGLELHLEGKITSQPYIEMTLALLNEVGISTNFKCNIIKVRPFKKEISKTFTVESDWSSASYFYSIVALSPIGTQIKLSAYKSNSLQGDAILSSIYSHLGIKTTFIGNILVIKKTSNSHTKFLNLDLANTPDIAQTIAVSCLGLNIPCKLTGLSTLKIKETDRLVALQNEIKKFGADVKITNNSLNLYPIQSLNHDVQISTYSDHRMAMAFATIAIKTDLFIEDPDVVSKSYPNFWKDLKTLGFDI